MAAGVSVQDFQEMDLLEVAYTIAGYRQRLYNKLEYDRYMAWVQMKPHIKENTLKTPKELFELPTDKKSVTTTREDVEAMQKLWEKADRKKWKKVGSVL